MSDIPDLSGMNMDGLGANMITVVCCGIFMLIYKKLLASKCRLHFSFLDCSEIEHKKQIVKDALREHHQETQRSLQENSKSLQEISRSSIQSPSPKKKKRKVRFRGPPAEIFNIGRG